MSHTPTPWEVMQPSQDTDDVIEIRSTINGWTVARMGDGDLIDEQDHDNAAHIVHCVNVHDQLVAALRQISEGNVMGEMGDKPYTHADVVHAYTRIATNALAAAEKGA